MVLFYVLIVCTVTLPPGVNPIAVDKYIYPAPHPSPHITAEKCSNTCDTFYT